MIAHSADTTYHTIFELLDAHERQDPIMVAECFESIAAAGASGKVSGLLRRLAVGPRGTSEKLLTIFAQFAKAESCEEERDRVVDALRVL